MAERIGVTYRQVLGSLGYHMALFYENSAGDIKVISWTAPFIA